MAKLLKHSYIILIVILLLSLFFRTYDIVGRFEYAHDGDLYSWIVKDIVVNQHLRLIGQETSAQGIFVGPLFYYLLVPFFILTKMDPIGAVIPATILGLLTTFSFYWVLKQLFNNSVGLLGAFLYAVLLSTVGFDRWVVPTVSTSLWTIWYFYVLIMIARGKLQVLPILAILIGLIWHIHLALIPTLLGLPIAFLIARQLPNLKQLGIFILTLVVFSIPLIAFELKHNFSQFNYLIANFLESHDGEVGLSKLHLIVLMIAKGLNSLITYPQSLPIRSLQLPISVSLVFNSLIVLLLPILTVRFTSKLFPFRQLLPIFGWMIGVILFFSFTSSPISEYYFKNLEIIFSIMLTLLLLKIFSYSKLGQKIVLIILLTIVIKNSWHLIRYDNYPRGYSERKAVAQFISADSKARSFPCVAVAYLTTPGEGVGFRYFFYLNNLHVNQPSSGSPVYTIVIPYTLSIDSINERFGVIGIIKPKEIPTKEQINHSCSGQNANLTDPLFGYVE